MAKLHSPATVHRARPDARLSDEVADIRLAAIVESSDDAIISKDLKGTITTWNGAATRMFGYTAEEVIGKSILVIVPPELHEEEAGILRRLATGERLEHYETVRLAKDGRRVEVSLTISPIRDRSGRVIGASKIARDVTEQRRLAAARFRLAAIVDSSDDAIVAKNLDGIITDWNGAATRIFGYEPHEIIGESILRLIPPDLQWEEPEILRRIAAGQRIEHYETQRVRKNGERFDVSVTISPIKDEKGRVIGASKIARDVTDRKRAEAALIESEKMATAGRLAAAIAHEVNNPLEAITNLAYLLAKHTALPEEARMYANMLLNEVGRASEIAKSTLSFYRPTTALVEVKVEELLNSLLRVQREKLADRQLKVSTEYRATGLLAGSPSELQQVFANLLNNSVEASAPSGEIRIRTSEFRDRGGVPHVRITFADHGSGIPPHLRQRIFEPFFTTKGHAGHGLGLWVTHSIVRKHGGYIRVRSSTRPSRSGTAVSIVLPRQREMRRGRLPAAERSAA